MCYLDGVAREKIGKLSEQDRSEYNAIVAHLRKFFKGVVGRLRNALTERNDKLASSTLF